MAKVSPDVVGRGDSGKRSGKKPFNDAGRVAVTMNSSKYSWYLRLAHGCPSGRWKHRWSWEIVLSNAASSCPVSNTTKSHPGKCTGRQIT
eukprot:8272818-Pyramimonas_sp.AAC.1